MLPVGRIRTPFALMPSRWKSLSACDTTVGSGPSSAHWVALASWHDVVAQQIRAYDAAAPGAQCQGAARQGAQASLAQVLIGEARRTPLPMASMKWAGGTVPTPRLPRTSEAGGVIAMALSQARSAPSPQPPQMPSPPKGMPKDILSHARVSLKQCLEGCPT